MSAAHLQLASHGQEDQWLTANPNRTFFETKYKPQEDRKRESFEIPFDSQGTSFGTTGQCTIPPKGDYLTRLTLRTTLPPIYPTKQGEYVYPNKNVGGIYVQIGITQSSEGQINTFGRHFFSVGDSVILSGTGGVDGTYTISTIPTSSSFTISVIANTGIVSKVVIQAAPIVNFYSTQNKTIWLNAPNKQWTIDSYVVNSVDNTITITTKTPSGFLDGEKVVILSKTYTVLYLSDTTFTVGNLNNFVAVGNDGTQMYSTDNGSSWVQPQLQTSGYWASVAYGNGHFVAVGTDVQMISTNGSSWSLIPNPVSGYWTSVAYGNGRFVAVGSDVDGTGFNMYSIDNGSSWVQPLSQPTGYWKSVAYGNGRFVAVGSDGIQMYSTDAYGSSWLVPMTTQYGLWNSVAYGNGRFVAVGSDVQMYSTDGSSWSPPTTTSGEWTSVAYGTVNGVGRFVAVGFNVQMYSTDAYGSSWSIPTNTSISVGWFSVAYGNGHFVAVGNDPYGVGFNMYSTDGSSWSTPASTSGVWNSVTYENTDFVGQNVTLAVPPIYINNNIIYSSVYKSITFANATDAAFWGFDYKQGPSYPFTNGSIVPQFTLPQGGWISGFIPPGVSEYGDSVAHQLCKSVRILVGKQLIKEYSGEYVELQNDLLVPYENKAILKLMNGTLDKTQATFSREYYVNLPIGTKEIPLCALTHQNMSIEIDFEKYENLSNNLNKGTGSFYDAKSYTNINSSDLSIRNTLSYKQYILLISYAGQLIVFDTFTQLYTTYSPSVGTSYIDLCLLANTLYILKNNGTLVTCNLDVLTFTPIPPSDITGTSTVITCDNRYIYYSITDSAYNQLYFITYDTTTGGYSNFNFTYRNDPNATLVYKFINTGSTIIALTNTPGTFYILINDGIWSDFIFKSTDTLTNGIVLGNVVYFVTTINFNIYSYSNGTFTLLNFSIFSNDFVAIGQDIQVYSTNGSSWSLIPNPVSGYWTSVAYGNGRFVAVGNGGIQMYSIDNGYSWNSVINTINGNWKSVAYGNGRFVAVGSEGNQMYSIDNGSSWFPVNTRSGNWKSVAYGTVDGVGRFVAVGSDGTQMYSTDGSSWFPPTTTSGKWQSVAYGNGRFVAVGSEGNQMYSDDGGSSWVPVNTRSGNWKSVAYGTVNGVGRFVAVGLDVQMYSTDGSSWVLVNTRSGNWESVAYGTVNGVGRFVAVGYNLVNLQSLQMYSTDGSSWVTVPITFSGITVAVAYKNEQLNKTGGFQNIIAYENYIYASSSTEVFQIDTTRPISSTNSYSYPAPIIFDSAPKIFAYGPRYIYMFTSGNSPPFHYARYDPYSQNPVFQASIIADYEISTTKPDKALIGIVQTQKITNMNVMDIHGPVKELWIMGKSSNAFQYADLYDNSTLTLTAGEQLLTHDIGTNTFLGTVQPFETHTSMPVRNISVLSMEIDPEADIPNGTVNFSRLYDQIFNGGAQTVWARNYNILSIQGGVGGLMFN